MTHGMCGRLRLTVVLVIEAVDGIPFLTLMSTCARRHEALITAAMAVKLSISSALTSSRVRRWR